MRGSIPNMIAMGGYKGSGERAMIAPTVPSRANPAEIPMKMFTLIGESA